AISWRAFSRTQRLERRAHLAGEQLRLLPGGEVTAFRQLVVVNELRIGPLSPSPRYRVDLVRIDADCDRDANALRRNEALLVLPIEARRGNGGVGQPVEGNIVEDVVPRQ